MQATPHEAVGKLKLFLALLPTLTSWLSVGLTIYFGYHGDIVWSAASAGMVCLTTTFNLIVCWYDHPEWLQFALYAIICLLQLKPIADARETHRSKAKQAEFRAKNFIACVLQAVPMSALISYVLALDLHGRLNEHVLFAVLGCLCLTFSLGTTHFAAHDDTTGMQFTVFVQVLAQFLFRMLAISAVWARFRFWGGLISGVIIFTVTYLAGPQGICAMACRRCWIPNRPEGPGDDCLGTALLKLALPLLTSFVVIDAVYEGPDNSTVHASDCFHNPLFLCWRVFENLILLVCFGLVPEEYWQRGNHELERWLANQAIVWVMGLLFVVLIATSWFVIRPAPTDHQPLREEVQNTQL